MKDSNSWLYQLGSLGSGNHFIEICLDEEDQVWVMLHSGSRGIGNHIGRYFIALAQKEMEVHFIQLPNRDLAYLCEGTQSFDDYVEAVGWAQDYALENRRQMMTMVLEVLRNHLPSFEIVDEGANCHHNYVALESHFGKNVYVTRKGAIRARKGDIGIIPGSMGARSYIVRGRGDKNSFSSCSHGAGRAMSRAEAKRRFTQEDLKKQTAGIECRKDKGVIDEIPDAYKSIDEVMKNQTDLVEVLFELRQVVNIKG
jgi:tRNA-splicing ligase RtcB